MDRKQLRRALGATGWMALLYTLLMSVCVMMTMFAEMIINMLSALSGGYDPDQFASAVMAAAASAWGYLITIGVGLIILLAWKKPRYWKEEIWAPGSPMKPGAFFGILCVFLSAQLIYQLYFMGLEGMLNAMGLTMVEGLEGMSVSGADTFSMFLYAGILGPIAEELLFRGLIQRTLMPYGRKLAVVGSAFLFGMMHGNILQTPFAFLVGLVLGWVTTEYSIGWAMVLHMVNNLVLADILTRLSEPMGELGATVLLWTVLILCTVGAIVTLIRKRREIRCWTRVNAMIPGYARCFFFSGGVITFTVYTALNIVLTLFVLITPL